MKLFGLHRLRLNAALGKGLAMLFAVQLVASAFCVVMPSMASAMTVEITSEVALETSLDAQRHCHADKMVMDSMSDMSESACVHCDVSGEFLKASSSLASNHLDNLQNTQFIAVMTMPLTMAISYDTQPLLRVRSHAPPRSSSRLFQTTLRILI